MLHRVLAIGLFCILPGTSALAQVTDDGTVGTVINGIGPYTITGGTQRLTTLFHSFSEFSPNSNDVTFALDGTQNAVNVVIGRVTGNNNSFIDGQLTLTGGNTPDLWILNPNGISFGENASLLLPGSFLATTAESIEFSNNQTFSTNTLGAAPILTISTPIGLQFGDTVSPIQLENTTLDINALQNLSLIGGDVTIASGNLNAPGGHLQLAGIDTNTFLQLDTDGTLDSKNRAIIGSDGFRNILIDRGASLNINGDSHGVITLMGKDITITNGSQIIGDAISSDTAGHIEILAAGNALLNNGASISNNTTDTNSNGSISLIGEGVSITTGATIYNQTNGTGDAGDIIVITDDFELTLGATIYNQTSGAGDAGDIIITTDDFELAFGGSIIGDTSGIGRGGDLNITADKVSIEDVWFALGASSDGDAGNINITANDSFTLTQTGFNTDTSGSGSAGNINFTAGELTIFQAGFGAQTYGSGEAGNITLTANTTTIEQVGFGSNTFSSGNAGNTTLVADTLTIRQSGFGVETFSSGNAGIIDIQANDFSLEDGSAFGAATDGTGDAGLINIEVDNFTLRGSGFGANVNTNAQDAIGGNINITVNDTMLMEQSGIGTDTFGDGDAGDLTVTAQNLIMVESGLGSGTLAGSDAGTLTVMADNIIMDKSGFTSAAQENSTGNSGNVNVTAGSIILNESEIQTTVKNRASNADSGEINIQADTILLQELDNENRRASIESQNLGDGNSGDINIAARTIDVQSGLISTAKFGSGAGSQLNIDVDALTITDGGSIFAVNGTGATGSGNSVDLVANSIVLDNGGEIVVSTGGEGQGGTLQLTTNRLDILNGAQIGSSSLEEIGFTAQQTFVIAGRNEQIENLELVTPTLLDGTQYGDAGNILLNANTINIQGTDTDGNVSQITAFSLTNGNAGSINIEADVINVKDRGELTVSGTNGGNAGDLRIATGFITLNNNASLRAATTDGSQGNIAITADRGILLSQQSLIDTNATGTASGGNITLTTPFLLSLENSDIAANAFAGNGGNITITTQGIFGTQFRNQLTSESDITASSRFGLNGTVNINNFGVDPNSDLTALPSSLANNSNQVIQECNSSGGNELIMTGRGGVPSNPIHRGVDTTTIWNDLRPSTSDAAHTTMPAPAVAQTENIPTEATTWYTNAAGKIELAAAKNLMTATTCTMPRQ